MRPTLHLPLTERRKAVRARGGHRRSAPPMSSAGTASSAKLDAGRPDIAACRVRKAGGPIDVASYVCTCGFVFAAAVSTSVECPHCGAPQAW